jgi:AcrR family transcriptional regulator
VTELSRRPGRPRSAEADERISAKTLELLETEGLRGLSVERVAEAARVGKTTVYRRFPTKRHLVIGALRSLRAFDVDPVPDTGTVRGDLKEIGRRRLATMRRTGSQRLVPRLLSEAADDPQLHQEILDVFIRPARQPLVEILRRGVERGELRSDVDPELGTDMVAGAIVYRLLLSRGDVRAVADLPDRAIELLLDGAGRRGRSRRATDAR